MRVSYTLHNVLPLCDCTGITRFTAAMMLFPPAAALFMYFCLRCVRLCGGLRRSGVLYPSAGLSVERHCLRAW